MDIRSEIKAMVSDFYKYMNTSIPEGVDGKLFTDLIYSNRSELVNFGEAHPEIDRRLLENIAIKEYLEKTDEEILKDVEMYGVERECKIYKRKYNTSPRSTSR
jgi:hypothetical protein